METTPRETLRRRGISMVESLIAVAVTAVAGGALLSSLGAAVQASTHASDALIARGLADQLMDEVRAARFPQDGDVRSLDSTRESFDDLDDYHGWSARPPVDRSGIALGQEGLMSGNVRQSRMTVLQADPSALANFTREVIVEPVESDGSGGWMAADASADSRRITVRVRYTDARLNSSTLAEVIQIISHVPSSP